MFIASNCVLNTRAAVAILSLVPRFSTNLDRHLSNVGAHLKERCQQQPRKGSHQGKDTKLNKQSASHFRRRVCPPPHEVSSWTRFGISPTHLK